jgi:hypothetical protein
MPSEYLHVVGVYSNPRRYASRIRLLHEWIEHMLDSGVSLTVVEHAFGDRPYELPPSSDVIDIVQVRGGAEHELWLKEGLVNMGFARLPDNAKYLCWEDADIRHVDKNWAAETIEMLQHHRVGQTWSHSMDLGPRNECVKNEWGSDVDRSFSAAWLAGDVEMLPEAYSRALLANKSEKDWRQHVGYSWAIRRDALRGLGRLLDWMVTGSADYYMALGFCGKLRGLTTKDVAGDKLSAGCIRRLREFAARCELYIKQDIGYVPGTILHGWHGPKRSRQYIDRKDILVESKFDPDTDITYDVHGLPTLVGDNRLLRDGLRRYGMQRNEDSVDL